MGRTEFFELRPRSLLLAPGSIELPAGLLQTAGGFVICRDFRYRLIGGEELLRRISALLTGTRDFALDNNDTALALLSQLGARSKGLTQPYELVEQLARLSPGVVGEGTGPLQPLVRGILLDVGDVELRRKHIGLRTQLAQPVGALKAFRASTRSSSSAQTIPTREGAAL